MNFWTRILPVARIPTWHPGRADISTDQRGIRAYFRGRSPTLGRSAFYTQCPQCGLSNKVEYPLNVDNVYNLDKLCSLAACWRNFSSEDFFLCKKSQKDAIALFQYAGAVQKKDWNVADTLKDFDSAVLQAEGNGKTEMHLHQMCLRHWKRVRSKTWPQVQTLKRKQTEISLHGKERFL